MKTRQEAIAAAKAEDNMMKARRYERMTDEQWNEQQAAFQASIASGAVAASVSRMTQELMAKTRK